MTSLPPIPPELPEPQALPTEQTPIEPSKRSHRRFWILFGLAVFITSVGVFAAFALLLGMSQGPGIQSQSTLSIDLAHGYPEQPLYEINSPFGGNGQATFGQLLRGIDRAAKDNRVENLLLRVRGSRLGWAHAVELRRHLETFKTSGKPLVAFIEFASNQDYLLATVADKIYLHPQTDIDLRGIRAEVTFLKGSLDKLGIEAEFERVGEYKSAPEGYTRSDMSEPQRESLHALIETISETIVKTIASARELEESEVRRLIAEGPHGAEAAVEAGLVDGTKYLDEVDTELSAKNKIAVTRLPANAGFNLSGYPKIAVIYGLGAIVPGDSQDDLFSGRLMGSDTIARAFRRVREDESIEAVVFRIDSPGGSDVASDIIWREAELTREKKPVIVSMGNVAASGGYWIAMASDHILAETTTITGSIGIYAGKFNAAEFYQWLGLNKQSVETSTNASFYSDMRSFTPSERAKLRARLEAGYAKFLERVSASRDKTTEEVNEIARGRVWSGESALELGLVDELGGLDRALEVAKERAGIEEGTTIEIESYPRQKSFFEAFLGQMTREPASIGHIAADPRRLLERSPFLRMLASGERLALLPYQIEIR